MPSYNCLHPTCSTILPTKGYCPTHQTGVPASAGTSYAQDYDRYQRDPWSKRFYASTRWHKTRRSKLARDPICEKCKNALALHVHHKKPVKQIRFTAPALLFAAENLQSLCIPCHNTEEKTVGESGALIANPLLRSNFHR